MSIPTPNIPPPLRSSFTVDTPGSSSNLLLGLLAGAVAMLIGTTGWVFVTVVTNFQIGYLAVGIGYLVGVAMHKFGRGHDVSFRIGGAALALLGCVLGNLFTGCAIVATQEHMTFLAVVSKLDFSIAGSLLTAMFSPMDLLFYFLAAAAGWRYSVR